MKRLARLFEHSIFWRLFVFLYFAARNVRVHPGVRFLARLNQLKAGAGTKISNDVRLVLGPTGQCVIGVGCWFEDGVEIQTDRVIEIGMGTTVRRNCSIHGSVSIGKHCIFAPNVFISSGSHIYKAWPELTIREQEEKYYSMPEQSRPKGFEDRPVIVEDDCWLGINVVVMPGVTIGKGSVLGANSVVTKSLPPNSVAVGIPARVIGNRFRDS